MYLAQFGFWDFNFLRIQYLSAGALFLLFVSFPAISFYAIRVGLVALEQKEMKYQFVKKNLFRLLRVAMLVAVWWLTSMFFTLFARYNVVLFSNHVVSALAALWSMGVVGMVKAAETSRKGIGALKNTPTTIRHIFEHFDCSFKTFLLFIAAIGLTAFFSLAVYPFIPHYLGGGEPAKVSIGLDSAKSGVGEIGLTATSSVSLIYQSSDFVLINAQSGTYSLKQEDVAYIKYLERNEKLTTMEEVLRQP